jgi:hypothetical protein
VDLSFLALGGVLLTTGFASQIRTPSIAGLQQAVLTLVALSVAGWLGGRVEPFIGPLVLLVAGPRRPWWWMAVVAAAGLGLLLFAP